MEGALGLARYSTETCVQLASQVSKSALNAFLDAVVPITVNAVVSRVNITEIVITGGVADNILGLLRFQAIETDNFISSVVDKVLFRNRTQDLEVSTKVDRS